MKTILQLIEERKKQINSESKNEVEKPPLEIPEKVVDEKINIILEEIEIKISKLSPFSGSYDCHYSHYLEDNCFLAEKIIGKLKILGYKASLDQSSGGSNYDSDGIPGSYWRSYSVAVDLEDVKNILFSKKEDDLEVLVNDLLHFLQKDDRSSAIKSCEKIKDGLNAGQEIPCIQDHTHMDDDGVVHFWSYSVHEPGFYELEKS